VQSAPHHGTLAAVNLDAYFGRIGYSGERTPTLSTLHAICAAHVQAIPFENLDVLLGRGISLADDAVEQKLVHQRRGGYCFEQNTLLLRVLLAMGYEARPISARVRLQRPRDFTPPRTHVFVRVELAGASYLADVGVGGLSPTCALALVADREQSTPHEPRRLVQQDGRWFHQAKLGLDWADVCEFTLEEMPAIDREVANWFTSTHPASHFRSRLLVARALPDGGRLTLLNRELTVRLRDQEPVTRMLTDDGALLSALAEHFGLSFPADTTFACEGLG
jgi:N-hydroxyarylamine O-acetyltransferase